MVTYVAGLDLGQMQDPSAIAVMKREPVRDKAGELVRNSRGRRVYDFRCLHIGAAGRSARVTRQSSRRPRT